MNPSSQLFSNHVLLVAQRSLDSEDVGPFLNVVTWVLLITSGLAVLTRLGTKRALGRKWDIDDGFVLAALITSVGSGIAVSVQVAHGLGQDLGSITAEQSIAYQKSEYANRLLYIATLAFAKLSIISLLMILTAATTHRRFGIALTTFIALWGLSGELIAAFQCSIDEPWRFMGDGRRCTSLVSLAFWRAMGALNMLTDLALILFPVHVIVVLQMSTGKKFTILIFFGARFVDIVATGIQIAYVPAFASLNPTHDLWKWTLTTQVVECITIITSCVPYLRPLLEALPSGLYGADELRRRGTSHATELGYLNGASYKLSTQSTVSDSKFSRKETPSEGGIRRLMPMLTRGGDATTHSNSASGLPGGPKRPDGETGVQITGPEEGSEDRTKWETDSTGSQARIIKTTTVSAAWENTQRRSAEASCDTIAMAGSS